MAKDIYKPTIATGPGSRTVSFSMMPGVAIYGGFMGNEVSLVGRVLTYPSSTTLSGEIGSPNNTTDNSYHVVYNVGGLTGTAVLDGFVIADGNANYTGSTDPYEPFGGGIYNKAVGMGTVRYGTAFSEQCGFQRRRVN